MTNYILTFISGVFLGVVFQNDIPIIKDIDHNKIRTHLVHIFNSLTATAK